MPLNQTQKYAIKILYHLAQQRGSILSAQKLNAQLGIPYKYLTHILTKLSKAKLIEGFRGKEGGFCFKREMQDVFLLEIIEAVGESDLDRCIINPTLCNCNQPCILHSKWGKLRKEIKEFLAQTSLLDLPTSSLLD